MGKRGNEHGQLSKEEYDALDSRGGNDGDAPPTGSFTRASNAQLTKRKILRVSNKFKSAARDSSSNPPGKAAPPSVSMSFGAKPTLGVASPPAPTASNNPFAKVTLPAGSTGTAPAKMSNNPFAQVKLSAPSAGSTNATVATFTSVAHPSSSSGTKTLAQKAEDLNESFLTKIVKLQDTHLKEDWTCVMQDYLGYAHAIGKKYYETKNNDSNESATSPAAAEAASAQTTSSVASTADPFNFTTTATSTTTTTAGGGGGSFGSFASSATSKTAAAVPNLFSTSSSSGTGASTSAGASFSTGFNFTKTSAPAPATTTPNTNGTDDEPLPAASAEPLGKAKKSDYDNKLTIGLVSAYKFVKKNGKNKKFVENEALHLETHKEKKTLHRMLMRNSVGKVMLNLAVSKGQKFVETKAQKNKKGEIRAYIRFNACQDPEIGLEMFTLSVQPNDLEKTMNVLTQMTK